MRADAVAAAVRLRRHRPALLRWYRRTRRDLPWRRTRDPYAIWVAEVMLQQTRVATVVPYFERFLARYPDPTSLAQATEDEVLATWSGLGYYRRARMLHAGARAICDRHGGRLPSRASALRALPGIGRYTAGAIASIAFGQCEPVVDGNVHRVLSRLLALDDPRPATASWSAATALVEGKSAGDLNQALMELGAQVCHPRAPACARCPLRESCRAHRAGQPERWPPSPPRPDPVTVPVAVAWIRRDRHLLVERPGAASPMRGRFDLLASTLEHASPADALRRVGRRHGLALAVGDRALELGHSVMNRRLRLEVFVCEVRRDAATDPSGLRWISAEGLTATPVSGATRKVIRRLEPGWLESPLG